MFALGDHGFHFGLFKYRVVVNYRVWGLLFGWPVWCCVVYGFSDVFGFYGMGLYVYWGSIGRWERGFRPECNVVDLLRPLAGGKEGFS